jgi:hypothetical protein
MSSAPEARSARPTLRLLTEDMGVGVPDDANVGNWQDPILKKARDLAPSFPMTQERVRSIRDEAVFRFPHARSTWVATWVDQKNDSIMWVCATHDGEGADETFGALYDRGDLLPSVEADFQRLITEEERGSALRFARALRSGVAGTWIERARATPEREVAVPVPETRATILLYATATEGAALLWVAVPTVLAPRPTVGLPPTYRAAIIAAISEALGDEAEFEQRHDWPARRLRHYEIAFLWLA